MATSCGRSWRSPRGSPCILRHQHCRPDCGRPADLAKGSAATCDTSRDIARYRETTAHRRSTFHKVDTPRHVATSSHLAAAISRHRQVHHHRPERQSSRRRAAAAGRTSFASLPSPPLPSSLVKERRVYNTRGPRLTADPIFYQTSPRSQDNSGPRRASPGPAWCWTHLFHHRSPGSHRAAHGGDLFMQLKLLRRGTRCWTMLPHFATAHAAGFGKSNAGS